jgi:hypothetical protein
MICHRVCDEFIFSLTESQNAGWNVNSCSPLFTGLHSHANVNKGYFRKSGLLADLPIPIDLTECPTVQSSHLAVISDTDNGGKAISAIRIQNTGAGVKSGIGLAAAGAVVSPANAPLGIVYDPCMDYEITFMIKAVSGAPKLDFSFYSYTESGIGPLQMLKADGNISSGSTLNNFLFEAQVNDFTEHGRWYLVRGIVFGLYTQSMISQQKMLNINLGQNLINGPANFTYYPGACHCFPTLLCDTGNVGEIRITDFAMRPLKTPYGTSFLNLNRWINIWLHNNNNEYTQQQIEDMLRYYFIPYNSTFNAIPTNSTLTGDKEADLSRYNETRYYWRS